MRKLSAVVMVAAGLGTGVIAAPRVEAHATATTPGFSRETVIDAGMSLLVPTSGSWSVGREDSGASPLIDVWSSDGDHADRMVSVALWEGHSLPSFSALRADIASDGSKLISIRRTQLGADTPAIIERSTRKFKLDDGTKSSYRILSYLFIGPSSGVRISFFRSARSDPAFDRIIATVVESLEFLPSP